MLATFAGYRPHHSSRIPGMNLDKLSKRRSFAPLPS
jgi:hypothetical protein